MIVHTKVGTGPMIEVQIRAAKSIEVGDYIHFRRAREDNKWLTGKVDLIKDIGFKLYYISLL